MFSELKAKLATSIESEIMVEMLLERIGTQHATLDPGLLIDAYLLLELGELRNLCISYTGIVKV